MYVLVLILVYVQAGKVEGLLVEYSFYLLAKLLPWRKLEESQRYADVLRTCQLTKSLD